MKRRHGKKLMLYKETLQRLTPVELVAVQGGMTYTTCYDGSCNGPMDGSYVTDGCTADIMCTAYMCPH